MGFSLEFGNISLGLLLLLLAIIYCVFCIKKPYWVVVFLAAYLPFEELIIKTVPDILYTPLRFLGEVTVFFLLCVYLFDLIILKQKWVKTPIDFPVLILLAAIFLSALVNHVPVLVALLGVKNLIRYIALFYLIILIKPSERQVVALLRFLFIIAVIQSGIAIIESLLGKPAFDFFASRDVFIGDQFLRSSEVAKLTSGSYRTMVFGTMTRYNLLGNYLSFWLGIAGASVTFKYHEMNIKYWQISLLLIALLLSYSRMSWIAVLFGIFILITFSKQHWILLLYIAIPVVVISIIAMGFSSLRIDTSEVDVGIGSPIVRLFGLFTKDYFESFFNSGRGYGYFSIAPAVLRINPVLGLGPGMIASDVSKFIAVPDVTDKLLLDNPYALRYLGDAGFAVIVSQLGILGLISIVMIFVQLFLTAFKLSRYKDKQTHYFIVGYVIILVMMIIFNLFSFALIYRVPGFYFWMFSAFIVLLSKKSYGISNPKYINQLGDV